MNAGSTPHPGQDWFKSSWSNDSQTCVEVCFTDDTVLIRDSKYRHNPAAQPVIAIPATAWDTFITELRGNEMLAVA